MPLASSMKIVVLAAYARAVVAGRLDPQAPVQLSDWERFYLPLTDGGAHKASLSELKLAADPLGHARDQARTVPLDTLARLMVQTSDNAATDLILTRLGREAVPETIRALNLTGQGDIGPVSGLFGAWDDPQMGRKFLTLTPAQRVTESWNRAEARRQREGAAQVVRTVLESPDAALAAQQHNLTPPMGTAATYARLMGVVLTGQAAGGTAFSPPELAIMRRHLGWPMTANPGNAQVFTALYAKGGSLSGGVLTNTFAFVPKVGPAAGRPLVISIFLRHVPQAQYGAIQNSFEESLLFLAIRPDAAQRLQAVLRR